jgi:hypothetical protein
MGEEIKPLNDSRIKIRDNTQPCRCVCGATRERKSRSFALNRPDGYLTLMHRLSHCDECGCDHSLPAAPDCACECHR